VYALSGVLLTKRWSKAYVETWSPLPLIRLVQMIVRK